MEDQKLKEEALKKLDEGGYIAIEGDPFLSPKDILTAIDVIDKLEAGRDETGEWNHIKKLQRERADRLSGGNPN